MASSKKELTRGDKLVLFIKNLSQDRRIRDVPACTPTLQSSPIGEVLDRASADLSRACLAHVVFGAPLGDDQRREIFNAAALSFHPLPHFKNVISFLAE